MRALKLLPFALCFGIFGCMTTSGMMEPDSLYPQALTECAADPEVPDRPAPGEPRTEKVKANYMQDVWAAGQDCRDTVGAVKLRKELYIKQYNTQTKGWIGRQYDAIRGSLPF